MTSSDSHLNSVLEMGLHHGDVWGHIAPMYHLVDVFAIYAITYLGGRHVTMPAFSPRATLQLIGTPNTRS